MRFVLVQCAERRYLPLLQWRATAIRETGAVIDVFFYAASWDAAENHIIKRYPDAVFSHHHNKES